jgi:putative ABC transport system substrate-binding protein
MAAPAQRDHIPRIGWLATGDPVSYELSLAAFLRGLRGLNYVEGRNIAIEYRWAQGNVSKLPALANELVQQKVEIILAGGSLGAQAAKDATQVIPIVAAGISDLVELGLVNNLARPGGNLTGIVAGAPETAAKRAEIIREIVPRVTRAAVLWNPVSLAAQAERKVLIGSMLPAQPDLVFYEAKTLDGLETALRDISTKHPDVVFVLNDPFMFTTRKTIANLFAMAALPAIYGFREYVTDGGLISYGPNISDSYYRAANYIDKILKGSKVGDLPVDLPTRFELVINLKTAKALRLDVPPSLLARADEVIE